MIFGRNWVAAHVERLRRTMKAKVIPILCCVLILGGCSPRITHRIAPGTDLVLPFGGSASYSGVNGDISYGEFEGPFGEIKLRGRSIYIKSESGWIHYPNISMYYRIEWTKSGLLFGLFVDYCGWRLSFPQWKRMAMR
jgi:hypothetical protein